jgi:hypothetical protein
MTAPAPTMLSVTDGRMTIGFLIRRGREGVEAFTTDETSIGVFKDERDGANAVWRRARGQA